MIIDTSKVCTSIKLQRTLIILTVCLLLIVSIIWNNIYSKYSVRHLKLREKPSKWTGASYLSPEYEVEPLKLEYMSATFVVYVYSSFSNVDKRKRLRKIFYDLFPKGDTRLLFVIGTPTKSHSYGDINRVEKELRADGDLLIISVPDRYENLSYKGMFALNWILNHCSSFRIAAKIDDDFVDVPKKLHKTMERLQEKEISNDILCGKVYHHIPTRGPINTNRLRISRKEYAPRYFPYYCVGNQGTYMTVNVTKRILDAAKDHDIFAIDDVYVSGLVRLKAGLGLAEVK